MISDDALLDRLTDALAPEPSAPSASELGRLRDALAARRSRVVPLGAPDRSRPRRPRPHPGRLAWIAGAAAVVVGLGAAGVRTDVMPGPLRSAAFAVGLPVSSPALVATRGDLSDLDGVLGSGRAASIRAAAAKVRDDLRSLDPDERQRVAGKAGALLAEADAETGPSPADAVPAGTSGSGDASGTSGDAGSPSDGPDGGAGTGTDPSGVSSPAPVGSSGSAEGSSSQSTTTTTIADNQDQSSTSGAQSNVAVPTSPSAPVSSTTTTTAGDG